MLEQLTDADFRTAMHQLLQLSDYGIRFIDGPYLPDEVSYDFRHTGFYGDDYYRYLDFKALSSSAGLSGSASALGLVMDINGKRHPTVAGLLLLGTESLLRQHLPSYEVAFQVLRGTDVQVNEFYRKPLLETFPLRRWIYSSVLG